MKDLNTKLGIAIDGTQGEIERVLSEIKDLQTAMKQKVDERNTLAKSHRDQQIVQSKWLEVLQQIEVTLAQACSAFENPSVLDEKMRDDVSTVFDRVLDNYAEYSQTEIKETDAIVDGKVVKNAWTPTEYIAKITGVDVGYEEDDEWNAEAVVVEPTLTKQAVKMFLINNEGEEDFELWSYIQESIGIVNKKRTLDTVANAIAEENISIEELEEYTEEYNKKKNRKERRFGQQQQLKLKAS